MSVIFCVCQQRIQQFVTMFTDLDRFYFRTINENSGADLELDLAISPILNINNAVIMNFLLNVYTSFP